jgi:DNA-binding NtrC family response regulator
VAIDLVDLIQQAEKSLQEGDTARTGVMLRRLRRVTSRATDTQVALEADISRYQKILERTLQVTLAEGLAPVASQVLDGMVNIVQAGRGFLGLVQPGDQWRILAARDAAGADLSEPEGELSTTIVRQCLVEGAPVVTHNAAGDEFVGQASVSALNLRSVACLPLQHAGIVRGFVYLDSSAAQGLFDEAAVAAVRAWLPIVGECLARALAQEAEPAPGLPGVVTRSSRMQAELQELGRIARFDVSVLLTGETGTGKSLVAKQLHAASARRAGPFVHINCGALPENLIEAELFGAEAGAFTGAQSRRLGKFEAARGGTVFLDELDTMPLPCQVKLLVALQERRIQRLGANTTIPIDVRVVAAMGSDPFEAIDSGRLREDLYYRLAVFVARLPALRERAEDVPLLARHFLAEASQRYGLAPPVLSEAALDQLTQHTWPGNVRELANTIDRAALLARNGRIESVQLRGLRRTRPAAAGSAPTAGVLEDLARTATAMVEAMERRPELRRLETADVLRGAVLLEATHQRGSVEEALVWLGLESQVRNRNHHRLLRREADKLRQLAAALDQELPGRFVQA